MNEILQGDALTELKKMPSESVNCVMTSPPYWALRDYGESVQSIWDGDKDCEHEWNNIIVKASGNNYASCEREGNWEKTYNLEMQEIKIDKTNYVAGNKVKTGFCSKCGAWKGQLGLEPTFDLFIKHLCDIFDEVKRVLRKDGTCWVNMGDTYGGTGQHSEEHPEWRSKIIRGQRDGFACGIDKSKILQKSLCLIPMRFAIEMVNRGWILRNTIIWHKPNCMPSSVKDRFTVDFEYVFFFVKNKKYWFETQYDKLKQSSLERINYSYKNNRVYDLDKHKKRRNIGQDQVRQGRKEMHQTINLENGRNKRTVWAICPKPFSEAHFAVYPEELCETPIKSGCPEFVCNKCGKAREKIWNFEYKKRNELPKEHPEYRPQNEKGYKTTFNRFENSKRANQDFEVKYKFPLNYRLSNCNCQSGFSGGIVLDPFFGSGTTGLVALKQHKNFIGIELNPEYIKIANERLKPYLEQQSVTNFMQIPIQNNEGDSTHD